MCRSVPLDLFRRALAAGMAALVLALTLASSSPSTHDLLHGRDGVKPDDHCAVVLLVSGVTMPLAQVHVAAPAIVWLPAVAPIANETLVSSPGYLHVPQCGPPALV